MSVRFQGTGEPGGSTTGSSSRSGAWSWIRPKLRPLAALMKAARSNARGVDAVIEFHRMSRPPLLHAQGALMRASEEAEAFASNWC